MKEVHWATPLYQFLRHCNASPLPKNVLDCGAGGEHPPLSLFHEFGYQTYGIEIARTALAEAGEFCRRENMPLNIIRGDMRKIPLTNQSVSFVYSFNAIDFMTKPDIGTSIQEMSRVLKPDGLCFVNFMSVEDSESWGPFCATAPARTLLQSESFSHFEDNEAEMYFGAFEIIRKEKRQVEKIYGGKKIKKVNIDYIARKKL